MNTLNVSKVHTIMWVSHCEACDYVSSMSLSEVVDNLFRPSEKEKVNIIKDGGVKETSLRACPHCGLFFWYAYDGRTQEAKDIVKRYVKK